MQYIIDLFKISLPISEGINNKIKKLKRMAYGYKNIEYFKLKIHQHCGLLNHMRFSTLITKEPDFSSNNQECLHSINNKHLQSTMSFIVCFLLFVI